MTPYDDLMSDVFILLGAIKFGDKLTVEKCEELLNQLSKCKAPFQCAHGRPSLAPIIELENMKMQPDIVAGVHLKKRLNFERLKENCA